LFIATINFIEHIDGWRFFCWMLGEPAA